MERRRNFAPLIAAVGRAASCSPPAATLSGLNKDDFQAMLGIGSGETLATAAGSEQSARCR